MPAVPFNAVVCPANERPTPANAEVVRVTARTGDSFDTIIRAQEGSTARSIVAGDLIFAAITAKTLTDLETPEITELRHSASQSISNTTLTALAFNTERRDRGGWHDNATNNSRITVPRTGIYALAAAISWDVNTTGVRYMGLRLNGVVDSFLRAVRQGAAGSENEQALYWEGLLNANDYVEVVVYQTSGAARTITSSDRTGYLTSPEFTARYVGV